MWMADRKVTSRLRRTILESDWESLERNSRKQPTSRATADNRQLQHGSNRSIQKADALKATKRNLEKPAFPEDFRPSRRIRDHAFVQGTIRLEARFFGIGKDETWRDSSLSQPSQSSSPGRDTPITADPLQNQTNPESLTVWLRRRVQVLNSNKGNQIVKLRVEDEPPDRQIHPARPEDPSHPKSQRADMPRSRTSTDAGDRLPPFALRADPEKSPGTEGIHPTHHPGAQQGSHLESEFTTLQAIPPAK